MSSNRRFVVLSYNVWFNLEVAIEDRMRGVSDIIVEESPDVICMQEMTPEIYGLLASQSWWSDYQCSVSVSDLEFLPYFSAMFVKAKRTVKFQVMPFRKSSMGRELIYVDDPTFPFVLATSHLESPTPPQFHEVERVNQMQLTLNKLHSDFVCKNLPRNVLFIGDLNWTETRKNAACDGAVPLPEGWFDCWCRHHSSLKPPDNVQSPSKSSLRAFFKPLKSDTVTPPPVTSAASSLTAEIDMGKRKREVIVIDDSDEDAGDTLTSDEQNVPTTPQRSSTVSDPFKTPENRKSSIISTDAAPPLDNLLIEELYPGYTYDGLKNPMLKNVFKSPLRLRLDRGLCFLHSDTGRRDYSELIDCRIVGTTPIKGVTYTKKIGKTLHELPVLPSDHYGLVVTYKIR